MGQAIHKAIEDVWINDELRKFNLKLLGHPPYVVNNLTVNQINESDPELAVFIEQRWEKKVGNWFVTGKSDFIGGGRLEDVKSTGVYGYMNGNSDDQFRLQGSIYRWLAPNIITEPIMAIQYIFTDWSALEYYKNKNKGYPPLRHAEKELELLPIQQTQNIVTQRIRDIERYLDADEKDLPLCTPKDLWQEPTEFKYFKNPHADRSTRNYENMTDAHAHYMRDKQVGVIKTVRGKIKRCKHCPGVMLCSQKDHYLKQGLLEI
jgi:hypothetical protein